MNDNVRIFIDETSHLERDGHYNMCIGSVRVPQDEYDKIKNDIAAIKKLHRSPSELKWNKFSRSRMSFYKDLIDYFFSSNLAFRCVLVKPKNRLDHLQFNDGSHDNFYYKMIYYLIRENVQNYRCRIYLDIKDTRGKQKLQKITEIYSRKHKVDDPFESIQHIRSEDNIFIQLADFFIGAVSYKGRALNEGNFEFHPAKKEFIDYLEAKSGFSLDDGTPPWEDKFNIFDFQPQIKKK